MFLGDYLFFSLLWTSFLLSLYIYLTLITMTVRWWVEHILQPVSLMFLILIIFLKIINPKSQQKVKGEAHWPIHCEKPWKSKTVEELKKIIEGDYCYKKAESAPKWVTPENVCGYQEQSWLKEQKWNTLMGMLVTTALLWSRQQPWESLKAKSVRVSFRYPEQETQFLKN